MKKIYSILLLTLSLCFNFASNAFETILDPYKFVWSENDGEGSGLYRFFLDINDDKKPDLFLGTNSLRGNGGGPVHIFLAGKSAGYTNVGSIDWQVIEVLRTKHHGLHDLKTYLHGSASEGALLVYSFDGTEYKLASNKTISSDEYSKQIHPEKIKEEASGPKLNWKP